MKQTPVHYQSRYYRHRLCGSDLSPLSAAMAGDGYGPSAAWFARWDEAADRRGLQLERQMGLACGSTARAEFFNEAMRQLMRELGRKAEASPETLNPPPQTAPAPSAEPALGALTPA
jgi:hypothetical protein